MKKIIIIFFSFFSFLGFSQTCQNPSPVFAVPNVTSAAIFWTLVPGAIGYNVTLVGVGVIPAAAGQTATTFGGLTPNTLHTYFVQAVCPQGNSNPVSGSFMTLPVDTGDDCPSDRLITQTATSNTENFLSAENTITARNIILSGVSAEYDAGNTVTLSPGFHARTGSTFKAFIEGCSPSRSNNRNNGIEEDNTVNEIVKIDKTIKIFPNPTTDMINVESESEIRSIQIINQIGNIGANQRFQEDHNTFSLNMTNYPAGIYFLRIIFEDGEILNKTVIKK